VPKPEENVPKPLIRVSAVTARPPSAGVASVSSRVVPPAAIAPESGTSDGVVDSASSSIVVADASFFTVSVGVLPPSGPTLAGV
jgi:hypothetical protein